MLSLVTFLKSNLKTFDLNLANESVELDEH